MTRGDRVITPDGPGTVNYVRMDYLGDITQVAAVSVVLDKRVAPTSSPYGYSGTIYPAARVRLIEDVQPLEWEGQKLDPVESERARRTINPSGTHPREGWSKKEKNS